MTNIHEAAVSDLLTDMLEHPEVPAVLADVKRRLENHEFEPQYMDAIGQLHERAGRLWPLEQVAAFLGVHTNVMSGRYAIAHLGVGEGPLSDSARARNAATLERLPRPFVATVDLEQNSASAGDGTLAWLEPIRVSCSTGESTIGEDDREHPIYAELEVPVRGASRVPLEIGTSLPSVTLAHLATGARGVARWPYGSSRITLFLNRDYFARAS